MRNCAISAGAHALKVCTDLFQTVKKYTDVKCKYLYYSIDYMNFSAAGTAIAKH